MLPLAEFRYIDKALTTLDEKHDQLEVISKLLQMEVYGNYETLYDGLFKHHDTRQKQR